MNIFWTFLSLSLSRWLHRAWAQTISLHPIVSDALSIHVPSKPEHRCLYYPPSDVLAYSMVYFQISDTFRPNPYDHILITSVLSYSSTSSSLWIRLHSLLSSPCIPPQIVLNILLSNNLNVVLFYLWFFKIKLSIDTYDDDDLHGW